MGDAEVVPLHDRLQDPAEDAKAEEEAALRRASFESRRVGAETRSGRMPKRLIAQFANGVTSLMLAKVLTEELVPTTAKEAAEVAKIAHAIAKDAAGDVNPKNRTAEEREELRSEAVKFAAVLEERARKVVEELGQQPDGGIDLSEWDFGEHAAIPDVPKP